MARREIFSRLPLSLHISLYYFYNSLYLYLVCMYHKSECRRSLDLTVEESKNHTAGRKWDAVEKRMFNTETLFVHKKIGLIRKNSGVVVEERKVAKTVKSLQSLETFLAFSSCTFVTGAKSCHKSFEIFPFGNFKILRKSHGVFHGLHMRQKVCKLFARGE